MGTLLLPCFFDNQLIFSKLKDALKQALKNTKTVTPGQKKPKRTPVLVLIIMCLLIFGLQYTTTFFSSAPQQKPANIITPDSVIIETLADTKPQGEIISSTEGTETGNVEIQTVDSENMEKLEALYKAGAISDEEYKSKNFE